MPTTYVTIDELPLWDRCVEAAIQSNEPACEAVRSADIIVSARRDRLQGPREPRMPEGQLAELGYTSFAHSVGSELLPAWSLVPGYIQVAWRAAAKAIAACAGDA